MFVKERAAAHKYPRFVESRAWMEHGPAGKTVKSELRRATRPAPRSSRGSPVGEPHTPLR